MDRKQRQGIIIVVVAIVLLYVVALFFTKTEADAAGRKKNPTGLTCKSKTTHIYGKVAGIKVWGFTEVATGCYWNDHVGVASFSFSSTGSATAPYTYVGQVGSWTSGTTCPTHSQCTHLNSHLVSGGVQGRVDFCVPLVGCGTIAYPWIEILMDSYGNWSVTHS